MPSSESSAKTWVKRTRVISTPASAVVARLMILLDGADLRTRFL
jgi:hypothetical protein